MSEETLVVEILSSGICALIVYAVIAIVLIYVDPSTKEKIRVEDLNSYNKIVGKNSILFQRGGESPADIGSYFRFYKYLVSLDAKNVIGSKMWVFYRIWISLYLLSAAWLVVVILLFLTQ